MLLRPPPPHPNVSASLNHQKHWWFVLGREPLLSAAEIFALLAPADYSYTPSILRVAAALSPENLMARLGGTIKIAEELNTNLTADELIETILNELKTIDGKIQFGLSGYGTTALGGEISNWGKKIKLKLKESGRSVRFVYNDEPILSSVTVEKNSLTKRGREFLITTAQNGTYAVAVTRAVQPFESFGKRDYGRPGRDDISGMLPPKLALMLLNISCAPLEATLLDPFCGSGTILSEAQLLGYTHLVGSDISDKAVADTNQNLAWFENKTKAKIFQCSVHDLNKKISAKSIQTIVTEPYMGPPLTGRETAVQIEKNVTELIELYTAAFQEFKKILAPSGTAVFIVPRFELRGKIFTISNKLVLKLARLGFTHEQLLPADISNSPFILYQRATQRVGREVWRFKLK